MSPATDCEEHGKQGGFKRLAQVIPTREVTALVNDRSRRMSERPVMPGLRLPIGPRHRVPGTPETGHSNWFKSLSTRSQARHRRRFLEYVGAFPLGVGLSFPSS
jgi:hypothetical protein